jgi:predicted ATPase
MNKRKKEFSPGKISFEIETLGPIRDSIVNFKPFLLFSGESNTGKSYTAIAVYYLIFMLDNEKIISELVNRLFDIKKIENDLRAKEAIALEPPEMLIDVLERLYNDNINRFMSYMLGYDDFYCNVKLKLNFPKVSWERFLIHRQKKEDGEYLNILTGLRNSHWQSLHKVSKSFDQKDIENFLSPWVSFLSYSFLFKEGNLKKFLLPPARGAFSGLTSSTLKKFSGIGMYNEFLEGIDSVRFSDFDVDERLEKQKKFINPLFEKLLDGKIKVDKDNLFLTITGSDNEVPLTAGSSSVKELFPLYLLLNRVAIERLSLCIEEPEAHLHPELQRSTALLLSYIVNQGGFIQVTTHSDFFVNQVNNLLKLHFIKHKEPHRFKKILKEVGIREEFVLDPKDMGAYYFEKVKDSVHARELKASENGMPLESFKRTYDQSVKETRNLREALTDDKE